MKRWTSLLVALLAAALMGLFGQAELDCLPESGTPGTFVYDYAGLISPQDEAGLNAYIRALNDTTPNSIVVVTHPDLCGEDPFDFATGVGRKWGVGDAEFDNGVVLALSPKTPERKGQVFIAVGYGLEGAIPDVTANRIIDLEMVPEFRLGGDGAYARGIQNAVYVLAPLASGEFEGYTPGQEIGTGGLLAILVVLFLIFGLPLIMVMALVRRYARSNNGLGSLLALILLANQRSSSGSYRHFRGGTGGFGGGGFGGSGGLGGGGFGGGGAGGSW